MRWKRILFLAFGHMASDFYPGMLSPLLPIITERFGWSIAQAGILVMVMQFFSNAVQPAVGILNDHRPMRSFLWAGLLISAIPFCFLLSISHFYLMAIILAVAGTGVAVYHPVGVVAASHAADEKRRGLSMALFTSGGSVGVTIAPLAAVLVVKVLGERYLPLIALPAVIMAAYFFRDRSIQVSEHTGHTVRELFESLRGSRRELFVLWLISSFRAVVYTLVGAFLPMLAIERGASYAVSAYYLSGALFAGMIGLFVGGHLSDRYGRRKIMIITMFFSTPLLFAFLHTSGFVSTAFLLLGYLTLSSTIPVNIIMAQQAAPKLAGMASSLVMGVSFMVGAFMAPPFGALADRIGVEAAMNVIFIFPVLGSITVLFLRRE